jgi:hypothetical protein
VSLSVCCITGDAAPRVAAILEPFRAVADEIVVAADARADRDRLETYAAVADRVLRLEFSFLERHLGWLHAQCAGDWVFRIDTDEVASPALVECLPELVADTRAVQYWFPRRWVYPDGAHWLDETPWWPDYQNRLVRNDGTLRFSGVQHSSAEPALPARYVEEPLLHLACVLDSAATRRSKAIKYEVLRPHLEVPGGGSINRVMYFPELYARRRPAPLPADELAAIGRVLGAADAPRAAVGSVPTTSLEESDRWWAGRALSPSAYAARIEPFELPSRLLVGETRAVHVRVTNAGSETWPWGDVGPLIRCAYRWLHPNGTAAVQEGLRTPFTSEVAPGERVVVPLVVQAPEQPGSFVLEFDLVHEHVRWFGATCRIAVTVDAREPERVVLPVGPAPVRSRGAPRGPFRRLSRTAPENGIPRVIHRVWLGGAPMPDELVRYGESWRRAHPGWKQRLWRDRHLGRLVPDELVARCRYITELSDLVRYEVVRRYGGSTSTPTSNAFVPWNRCWKASRRSSATRSPDGSGLPSSPRFPSIRSSSTRSSRWRGPSAWARIRSTRLDRRF